MVRPTTDMVREALFQVLDSSFGLSWERLQVLDLFAGSGALGLEAISRRAEFCLFVEGKRQISQYIRRNLVELNIFRQAKVVTADVFSFLKREKYWRVYSPFDLVFADPPYGKYLSGPTLEAILRPDLLSRRALVIIEERKVVNLEDIYSERDIKLVMNQKRVYGDTCLFFYEKQEV